MSFRGRGGGGGRGFGGRKLKMSHFSLFDFDDSECCFVKTLQIVAAAWFVTHVTTIQLVQFFSPVKSQFLGNYDILKS